MTSSDAAKTKPIDAATVVVARDTSDGIEVLMLRKSSKVYFGGMWVFPGGKVDTADREGRSDIDAFRRAAVREAHEEAAIGLDETGLVHFSHWLPPPIRPKRFSTHFFLARAPVDVGEVEVDGGEITEHAWITPAQALERRHQGDIELVTPTFATLDWLRRHRTFDAAVSDVQQPICFHTHITRTESGNIAFYAGDVAYESLDHSAPGPRRRLNMLESGWWWEEHDGDGNGPWIGPVGFEL
jgi:8-oxo-dGTP pyrophosphatase MutT (NUDIX family)